MFQELIKLLKKIDSQYEVSECEQLMARQISGYLTCLFTIYADKAECVENLEESLTELFYLNASAFHELNSELDSNLETLKSAQFKKLNVAHIFEQLYLTKLRNVIKTPDKGEKKPAEYKAAEIIDIPPIPDDLFSPLYKRISYIPIEIVNLFFISNIVSLVTMSRKYAVDDQDICFIRFCTQDESKIRNEMKTFSLKTNISLEKLDLTYKAQVTYEIWLYGKNIGIFLYAISSLIKKFNKILSFSITFPKEIQSIISDYCGFNHKVSKNEISTYLNSSDLFRLNLRNAFNNPDGLRLEEMRGTSSTGHYQC